MVKATMNALRNIFDAKALASRRGVDIQTIFMN
jgi:ribosomal protein S5